MDTWISAIVSGSDGPERMRGLLPGADDLAQCIQDPVFHAEGDVWTHTVRVRQAFATDPALTRFSAGLPHHRRVALFAAAWLHDNAKPETRSEDWDEADDRVRISHPGHAGRGADKAWRWLLDGGMNGRTARAIWGLIAWHHRAPHLWENGPARAIAFAATGGAWDDALVLGRADVLGRTAADAATLLERLDLSAIALADAETDVGPGLANGTFAFATPESRLRFSRAPQLGLERVHAPMPHHGGLVLLSGLPGSGKTHIAQTHFEDLPRVSLDALRTEMGVGDHGNQGTVIAAAFEQARTHLRAGERFVWDATTLSRRTRAKIVGLARDYGAPIDAYTFDIPLDLAHSRNMQRETPLPFAAMVRMASLREPVGADEAHRIFSVAADGTSTQVV